MLLFLFILYNLECFFFSVESANQRSIRLRESWRLTVKSALNTRSISALQTHTKTHTHTHIKLHTHTHTHTMAWRFKASKYKNAAPIVPKAEACVREICVGSYQTYGNNIAASAAFMAFNWEHSGSSVAVLPLDDCGRKSKTMPLLHGHTDTVTDLKFSPFHDGLLATASQDCLVSSHSGYFDDFFLLFH